jgi:hypothetical protein
MKNLVTLLVLSILIAPRLFADFTVHATFAATDPAADSSTQKVPSVQLYVLDGGGKSAKKVIVGAHSGALDLSKWSAHRSSDGTQVLGFDKLQRAPSSGAYVTELNAWVKADAADADLTKEDWRLHIAGTARAPALTLTRPDGSIQTIAAVDIAIEPLDDRGQHMLALTPDFEHQITLGGGEDGSILALSLHFNPPPKLTKDDQPYGMNFDFEGTFTPDPDDALKLYGKFEGDLGVFHSLRIPASDFMNGSVRLAASTHIESDQKVDNYNWTVGVGAWGFLRLQPVTTFSKGLYSVVNLGQRSMTDAPILTLFSGYEYIASSELDATAEAQGNQRMRFRARYRTPLWRDVDLPILPTVFDVDAVADISGVWDFDHSRVLPEFKASIEFMPRSVADQKLAFTLTYISGKISPTFVDEDAFLAGLKFRF